MTRIRCMAAGWVGLLLVTGWAASQAPAAVTTAPVAPPVIAIENQMTRAQLEKLLLQEQTVDEQPSLMHQQLEAKRATLPTWFPATVWDDVEKQVAAIQYVTVALPAYQKWLTTQQAGLLILFFEGSTGRQIASKIAADKALIPPSGQQPKTELPSGKSPGGPDMATLFSRRVAELSQAQQLSMLQALPATRAALPQAEIESNAAYNARAREVLRSTVAAHQAEITKAQQTAGHP